jgi:hypothetical protein
MIIKLCVVSVTLLSLALMLSVATAHAQTSAPLSPPANAIPARVMEDPSVRTGWRRYGFGATPNLSVILPGAPSNAVEVVDAQVVNTYISTTSSGVYAAVRVDRIPINLGSASEEARSRYFREFFQGFAKGFHKGLGSTVQDSLQLLEVTTVKTAAGRDGYQQRLTIGTMQGRAQMMFVGNSAFCIVAFWLPTAPAADYDSFFGSFRITSGAN